MEVGRRTPCQAEEGTASCMARGDQNFHHLPPVGAAHMCRTEEERLQVEMRWETVHSLQDNAAGSVES